VSDIVVVIEEPVRLTQHRCWECGRWWAYERFSIESPECPVCAGRALQRVNKRIAELERSNASLRGALTRAKEVR